MLIIIVADIFGRTRELEELSRSLGKQTEIVDPYASIIQTYCEETEAYDYFIDHVGIITYSKILQSALKPISKEFELIGFSVGASAIWKISDRLNPEMCKRAVCFYGSQMRHYQAIIPQISIELVFPAFEPSFDVNDLSKNMSDKLDVKIHKTRYLHGFMNYHSKNYSHIGYVEYLDWLNKMDFRDPKTVRKVKQ